MTLLFIDSFSHYSTAQLLRKWTSTTSGGSGSVTISANGRYSVNSLRILGSTGGFANAKKSLAASATWRVGFAFKASAIPTTTCVIAALLDVGSTQCDLRFNTDGTLSVTRNGTAVTGGTSSFTLLSATWYYIELKATIADSIGANTCKVRVNGSDVITVTTGQDIQATANSTANQLLLGQSANAGAVYTYDYCDLYVCDASGSVNNDFLGDCRVECLLPSGAGTNTAFTASTGANYTCVDENPATDDTDYVESSTATQKDTYAMGNLSSTANAVYGVQTCMTARKTDAGARSVAAVVRSGSTDYDGATVSLADTYSILTEIRETDPNNGSWTPTTVNAMEAGIKLVS